jgi:hypothetical protein
MHYGTKRAAGSRQALLVATVFKKAKGITLEGGLKI